MFRASHSHNPSRHSHIAERPPRFYAHPGACPKIIYTLLCKHKRIYDFGSLFKGHVIVVVLILHLTGTRVQDVDGDGSAAVGLAAPFHGVGEGDDLAVHHTIVSFSLYISLLSSKSSSFLFSRSFKKNTFPSISFIFICNFVTLSP